MIKNHFEEPLFAIHAASELGLTLFTEEEIRSASFRKDVTEGDYFLQYRRPGFRGHYPPRYREKELRELPALLKASSLAHPEIGYWDGHPTSGPGFRIFKVTKIMAQNDRRAYFEAVSLYSTPSHWSFRSRYAQSHWKGDWVDSGSKARGASLRNMSFTKKIKHSSAKHHGVIGKFDTEVIAEYITDEIKTKEFYALFRALTTNQIQRPSVVSAVRDSKVELEDISL